jgi:hypothetical protein
MAGRTQAYYDKNPAAKAKKKKYDTKYNKKKGQSEYRSECNKGRKDLGLKKGDSRDASHTKSGGMVAENKSKNRARNGHNNKSTRK